MKEEKGKKQPSLCFCAVQKRKGGSGYKGSNCTIHESFEQYIHSSNLVLISRRKAENSFSVRVESSCFPASVPLKTRLLKLSSTCEVRGVFM